EFVNFACARVWPERSQQKRQAGERASLHLHQFAFRSVFFSFAASAFKSGVRDRGSFPNKFPSAKAGLLSSRLASCTPAMRASSVSKCATARTVASFESR